MGAELLRLESVHAAYGQIEVLHGIDFRACSGEVVAVLGANGAGKTTLLRTMAGLHVPTKGNVIAGGRKVNGASADALARRGLCLIPAGRGIFPTLTVHEHLRMVTHLGVGIDEVESIVYGQFPNLAERRDQAAGTMSGGEQQMLAMARAFATRPAVLLLDELSMGLAPIIVRRLHEIVTAIASNGTAVVIVEQFANTIVELAQRAVILASGRVVAAGDPADLQAQLSAAYLGG